MQNCRGNDNWCYSNCKKDCGGIDIEKCKRYGQDVGYNAAKTACDMTVVSIRYHSQPTAYPCFLVKYPCKVGAVVNHQNINHRTG